MSKVEERAKELIKKAKDFIPDGGYSEKELNLAFFMFIKGYRQAEKDLELTCQDIVVIETLLKFVRASRRYKNGYKEVLERFNERRNK